MSMLYGILKNEMPRLVQTISLFPSMFEAVLGQSMMWKAQDRQLVKFKHIDLRHYGLGPRKQVDDTPYGGGDGMLLMIEPLVAAVEAAKKNDPTAQVVLMTPRGTRWAQKHAQAMAAATTGLIFVCARYEGYDERITALVDQQ